MKGISIYSGAHPVHVRFGESVGARAFPVKERVAKGQFVLGKFSRLLRSTLNLPEGFDFALTENCYYYPAVKRKLGGYKSTKIINLAGGPLYYHLITNRLSAPERKTLLWLAEEIDGHLVLGKYGEETLKKTRLKQPYRIVYPFILNENFIRLKDLKPDLDSKNIMIAATNDYLYKGLDVAIEAVKKAAEQDNEIRLNIVGNIDKKTVERLSGGAKAINHMGFVPDLAKEMEKNSLYLHPSRGDTFPVSVLEAMLGGIPSIVSHETGTREAVEKADPKFVKKRNLKKISEFILEYFSLGKDEKKHLSEKFRKAAMPYGEKPMLEHFRKQFFSLIKETD